MVALSAYSVALCCWGRRAEPGKIKPLLLELRGCYQLSGEERLDILKL